MRGDILQDSGPTAAERAQRCPRCMWPESDTVRVDRETLTKAGRKRTLLYAARSCRACRHEWRSRMTPSEVADHNLPDAPAFPSDQDLLLG